MRWVLCLLLAATLTAPLRADEQVRRVQEELRRRRLYFGDIDGRKTDELTGAIRSYQERKGFSAKGELDNETLHALDLPTNGPIPKAAPWPDEPVLKSDLAHLKTIETPPPPPVGAAEPAMEPLDPKQLREFILAYLHDAESNSLKAEMSYYAEPLDYFDSGIVDIDYVQADIQRYYARWPKRRYELLDFKVVTEGAPAGAALVKFRIRFTTSNDQHSVSGATDNVFTVKNEGGGYKIVALREHRVRNG